MGKKQAAIHPNADVAVGYKRVSTPEQGDSGLSMMEQDLQVQRYCEYQQLRLLKICDDEATGTTRDRDGLREALELIKTQQARFFIVKKLNRLGRKAHDMWNILHEIQEAGGELVILDLNMDTRTVMGRMIFTMVAHIAEGDAETISQQTKSAMVREVLPREGVHVNRNGVVKQPPGRKPQIDPTVRKMILRLRARVVQGPRGRERQMPFGEIAQELEKLGFEPPKGGAWSRSTIQYICEGNHRADYVREVEPEQQVRQAS